MTILCELPVLQIDPRCVVCGRDNATVAPDTFRPYPPVVSINALGHLVKVHLGRCHAIYCLNHPSVPEDEKALCREYLESGRDVLHVDVLRNPLPVSP